MHVGAKNQDLGMLVDSLMKVLTQCATAEKANSMLGVITKGETTSGVLFPVLVKPSQKGHSGTRKSAKESDQNGYWVGALSL